MHGANEATNKLISGLHDSHPSSILCHDEVVVEVHVTSCVRNRFSSPSAAKKVQVGARLRRLIERILANCAESTRSVSQ